MQVEHVEGENRFVARTEAGEAELAYAAPREGVLDLLHTFVPPDERGQGMAESLVRAALAHARENDLKIVPSCPFVMRYMEAHPDQAELVARS